MSGTNGANFITCPDCGGELRDTVDSRPYEFNGLQAVKRRRVCRNCKQRQTTLEVPITYFDTMRQTVAKEMLFKMIEEMTSVRS